jgi:lipopolysaccharide export system permease protein
LFRWLLLDRLDRYALRLLFGPLALALLALLLAQLLERLLRLFDLAASAGAPPTSVLTMASMLVPHYLGLSLPMAFTAAVFMAVAHMGDENELDVMLVTGRSIARVAAPYFWLAMMLSLFSFYLYGQIQPLARYGYNVTVNQVLRTGWDSRVEENRFIDIGNGTIFTADQIVGDGRDLRGVFMEKRKPGSEDILTAQRGRLESTPAGLQLQLEEGQIVRDKDAPVGSQPAITISRFERGISDRDFKPSVEPLAARGGSERELTLRELWRDIHATPGQHKKEAEFHGRLARTLLFPLLPLLALPLGMASKRGRRAPGVVFAVVALVALDHALQFGESLGDTGRLPAAIAVWTPYALFGLMSVWIFFSSLAWPGDNPVLRAVVFLEGWIDRARTHLPRSAQ